MNTVAKLGVFAGALALAFGGAFVVGNAADPVVTAAPETDGGAMDGHAETPGPAGTDEHGGGHESDAGAALPGLAVSEAGYTLVPAATTLTAGRAVPFRFSITGPDGRAVTAYELEHEKELHLIVVRRDLSGFQHVHPTRAADGTWSIELDVSRAGTWRVFADFKPTGLESGLTLGTDVTVGGGFTPVPLPAPATKAAVDGYDVTLAGTPVAGKESELTFTVRRGGRAVTDLQPYLGAFGHLVSLRTGDLAYLHTHPGQEAHAGESGGPDVRFATTFPTAATYRLFLDFQHGGKVHTAEFTVTVGGAKPVATATPTTTATPTIPVPPTIPGTTPTPGHATTPHGHS